MFALAVYILFGLVLAWRVLPSYRGAVKCWMGLVFGCVTLQWLPCLAAFFLGFTKAAQNVALGLACAGTAALAAVRKWPRGDGGWRGTLKKLAPPPHSDLVGLLLASAVTVFCGYLLHTHVLLPHDGGSLWVGQSTYGDLAMHLGFVESLYRQGSFPPEYSIYPGQRIDYPFLVDAASASLRFFGLSLRMSVILPSLVMLFGVFYGFWLLADKLTGKLGPAVMAWLLFVFNGGFAFLYFMGPWKQYTFQDLISGFYITPTNLIGEDIRWVNVICDMLIPQRTTMAGWCVGIAAIYLLITGLEKTCSGAGRREFAVLAVTAGAMPMIHTHTFLALGVLSGAWFFCWLHKAVKGGFVRRLVENYVLYGVICFALALPQLIVWTFDAASTGNLLWLNPGWVHGDTNWLIFWAVNGGVVFCAMIPMMLFIRGDKARLFIGAMAVFVLANLVAFQPNPYDDNKLLYIWFMVTDILVCGWLWEVGERRLRRPVIRRVLAGLLVILGTLSGIMSLMRETASEYQLLSTDQVAAAAFIEENTPADSLFLTATTSHVNPVAILSGRNVLCGSPTFLYYHGIDYSQRAADVALMYQGGSAFTQYAEQYGVDYVYIGGTEYTSYQVDYSFFAENYPLVYSSGNISIFQISS